MSAPHGGHFGGIPTLAVPDNAKTGVTKAHRYDHLGDDFKRLIDVALKETTVPEAK